MKTTDLLSYARPYLEANALCCIAWACFWALSRIAARFGSPRRFLLKLGQGIFIASFLFPFLTALLPKQVLLRPAVQVWSGLNRSTSTPYALFNAPGRAMAQATLAGFSIQNRIIFAIAAALALGLLINLVLILRRGIGLWRYLGSLPQIKKIGRVRVLASTDCGSAFSTWILGRACVVIPATLLTDPKGLRITLRHEIQHHRQGDTRWVLFMTCLKPFLFWNPAIYGWERLMIELQEFACDETLIGRRNISPQSYGRCLLKAAESAVGSRVWLVGTTGMAASASGHLLTRRIEMMFAYRSQTQGTQKARQLAGVMAMGTLVFMASIAFASRSAVQDRIMTLGEAQALARKASQGTEIPITVNDLVLARLNQYIGTPEGRKYVKNGLTRMPMYQAMIEREIDAYGVPSELLATALFESGFENGAVSPAPARAAGIWQFVAETARRYDLEVDGQRDERFDPDKETVAAMRYLKDLFGMFQDWRLALMSYNAGEHHVQQLIDQFQTRDPWELERLAPSKERYLAGTMAMIIILKNPSLLD